MEYLSTLNDYSKAFFSWFGKTYVLGIPLNIPAHIIVSGTIFYILAVRKFRLVTCFLVVLAIGTLKEIYDLSAIYHNGDYMDPVRSMFGNFIGIFLGYYLSRPVDSDKSSSSNL